MDPIDQAMRERDQALVAAIRKELRYGALFKAISLCAFVIAVLFVAFDVVDHTKSLPLIVGLGIMLIAMGRMPQRERLLKEAAERLAANQH